VEAQVFFFNEIFVQKVMNYTQNCQIIVSIPFIFNCDIYEFFYFLNFDCNGLDINNMELIIGEYNKELLINKFSLVVYYENNRQFVNCSNFEPFSVVYFNDIQSYIRIFQIFDIKDYDMFFKGIIELKSINDLNFNKFKEDFEELMKMCKN
jgi:hypothetical protein